MAGDDVFLGRWTNWSRGPVLGPTLTMTQEDGKYLIAFIAFFVTFVATRFWRVCCFFLHRHHSTNHPSTAPYHQRQAILRNSSSPESGLVALLCLCWAWRQPRQKQLLALLSPAVVAFLVLVGFTLAGVFSSQISSTAGNEVLLSNAKCGIILGTSVLDDDLRVMRPYQSSVIDNALNYAQQCYSSSDTSMVDCNRFVTPRLVAASIDYSAGCPFESKMCRTNTSNLRIDSGYIDSNRDLGMNAAADERFKWRTVLHCAPLVTEGYQSNVTYHNQTFIRYHYGRASAHQFKSYLDYTYEVSDFAQQYPDVSKGVIQETKEFRLNQFTSYMINGSVEINSLFEASPEIQTPYGDTSIIFLVGNGVVFAEQPRDEWYRASTFYGSITHEGDSGKTRTPGYRADEAASPLGCVNQYQYCIVGKSGERQCGPLSGRNDYMVNAALAFGITDQDMNSGRPSSSSKKGARFSWTTAILDHAVGIDIDDIVGHLGPRSLASQAGLSQGLQAPLLVDQWKYDVTRWYNASRAATQAAFTDIARGTSDQGFENCTGCVSPTLNAYEESMCQNQKILSTAYASFSLFGLCFTFVTGLTIVLLSYVLEPIFEYLLRHNRQCDQYKYLEWTSHSVLQLQRQGHEALGLGTWEKCSEEVPVCKPDEMMGILDITDGSHPLLRRPSFDGEALGEKPDQPGSTEESVSVDESEDGQTGGQGNGEFCTDQAASLDDTGHTGGDPSSSGDSMAAPNGHTFSSETTSATPKVHVDQSSMTTADRTSENTSD